MKFLSKMLLACSLMLGSLQLIHVQQTEAAWAYNDVDPMKTWTVQFTLPVDSSTVTEQFVYVVDSKGIKQNVTLTSLKPNTIVVAPPPNGYESGETYRLIVSDGIQSIKGSKLRASGEMTFTTKAALSNIQFVDEQMTEALQRELQTDALEFSIDELAAVTYLFTYGVQNLEGLHLMPNLTELHLHEHQLVDVALLEQAKQLEILELSYSLALTDLNGLQHLTQLQQLNAKGNKIANLAPIRQLQHLTHLDLAYNQISDASDLATLTNLVELDLSSYEKNALNTISDLAFLANMTKLERLHLQKNNVQAIDVLAKLPALKYVDLRGNELTANALPIIAELKARGVEVLHDRIIVAEEIVTFTDATLEKWIRKELAIAEGPITKTDLLNLKKLSYHNVGGMLYEINGLQFALNLEVFEPYKYGQLTDLSALQSLEKLKRLDLGYNLLADISVLLDLPNLEWVSLYGNPLNAEAKGIIEQLKAHGVEVEHDPFPEVAEPSLIKDPNLEETIRYELDKMEGAITLEDLQSLTTLSSSGYEVVSLEGLEHAVNLKWLSLDDNYELSDISQLAYLTQLEHLQMCCTQITDITPLATLQNLKVLEIFGNQIADYSVIGQLSSLEELVMADLPTSNIDFLLELPNLKKVNMGNVPYSEAAVDTVLTLQEKGVIVQHDLDRQFLKLFLTYMPWSSKNTQVKSHFGTQGTILDNLVTTSKEMGIFANTEQKMVTFVTYNLSDLNNISQVRHFHHQPINATTADVATIYEERKNEFTEKVGFTPTDEMLKENDGYPAYEAVWTTRFERARLFVYYSTKYNGVFMELTISPIQ